LTLGPYPFFCFKSGGERCFEECVAAAAAAEEFRRAGSGGTTIIRPAGVRVAAAAAAAAALQRLHTHDSPTVCDVEQVLLLLL